MRKVHWLCMLLVLILPLLACGETGDRSVHITGRVIDKYIAGHAAMHHLAIREQGGTVKTICVLEQYYYDVNIGDCVEVTQPGEWYVVTIAPCD